jgi:hypothetical protein
MKRNVIVGKLIKEGFSEKTLVNLSDKQLANLSERMFKEEEGTITADDDSDPDTIAAVASKGENVQIKKDTNEEKDAFIGSKKGCKVCKMSPCKCGKEKKAKTEVKETLKGNQTKIDKNHNGKIDAEDFKILKGKKKIETKEEKEEKTGKKNVKICDDCGKPMTHCTCNDDHLEEGKKNWIQKAIDSKHKGKLHKDLGVPKDKKIPSSKLDAAAKKGGKIGKEARLAKTLKKLQETDSTLNAKRNLHFELKEAGASDLDLEIKDLNELANKYSKKHEGVKNAHDFYKRITSKQGGLTGKNSEVKEWVMNLAENRLFHPMTSKGEILTLIKSKLNESKK